MIVSVLVRLQIADYIGKAYFVSNDFCALVVLEGETYNGGEEELLKFCVVEVLIRKHADLLEQIG